MISRRALRMLVLGQRSSWRKSKEVVREGDLPECRTSMGDSNFILSKRRRMGENNRPYFSCRLFISNRYGSEIFDGWMVGLLYFFVQKKLKFEEERYPKAIRKLGAKLV